VRGRCLVEQTKPRCCADPRYRSPLLLRPPGPGCLQAAPHLASLGCSGLRDQRASLPPTGARPAHRGALKSIGPMHEFRREALVPSFISHLCFSPLVITEKLAPLDGVASRLRRLAGGHGLYSEFDNFPLITRRTRCAYPLCFSNNSRVLR